MTDLPALTPGTWNVDPAHSTVGFVARHLMITKVRGRFTDFSGTIEIAPDLLQSRVEATVNLASVSTGDDARDAHLRSADFFAVDASSEAAGRSPVMTFASTGIKDDDGEYVLYGDLTVNGVTRQVELALEFDGVSPDPWGGTRAAFSAETEINRKDFGLGWNVALETGGVLVGDKVKVELDIQAVKA